MRQAGRYLPEYRAIRSTTRSFLDFCYTPDKAVEATLQPVRRFGFDAAILFSDILVVPDAMGQKVWFEEGAGPRLNPIMGGRELAKLTAARVADALPKETALIGFAGAPWPVAAYMVEGRGSRDFAAARHWAATETDSFARMIEMLIEATTEHLSAQVEAGAV